MKIILAQTIKELRRARGINQEVLAECLDISTQAVSKWECGLSCPDIELLPKLAKYFDVSIDYLLTGRDTCPKAFPDDGVVRVVKYQGSRLLEHHECVTEEVKIRLDIEGLSQIERVEICGNAEIRGVVCGNVNVEGNVACETVKGKVSSAGNISCGTILGAAHAGGNITCGEIGGPASAGGNVIFCK